MMAKFEDAEKRRSTLLDISIKSKDMENMSTTQLWTERVLNKWDSSVLSTETRDLWWRGIPSTLRGQIWAKAIGNDLHLTAKTYVAALKRGRATEHQLTGTSPSFGERHGHISEATEQRRSLATMHSDITSTFPALSPPP